MLRGKFNSRRYEASAFRIAQRRARAATSSVGPRVNAGFRANARLQLSIAEAFSSTCRYRLLRYKCSSAESGKVAMLSSQSCVASASWPI